MKYSLSSFFTIYSEFRVILLQDAWSKDKIVLISLKNNTVDINKKLLLVFQRLFLNLIHVIIFPPEQPDSE